MACTDTNITTKNKTNRKRAGRKQARNQPKRQAARKPRRRVRTGNSRHSAYAAMIADPCNATLVPGMHSTSEGYLSKHRSSITNQSAGTAGYLLWVPEYHTTPDTDGGITHYNLFAWSTQGSNFPPSTFPDVLGSANSFVGSYATATTAGYDDPAGPLLRRSSQLMQDARTVSACIRMCYTGEMQHASGQLAYIENLPLSSVVGRNANESPLTVDQLFTLSSNVQRLGVDTYEVVFRPPESGHTFHDYQDGAWVNDTTAVDPRTIVAANAAVLNPVCFGFAWRSLAADPKANLDFELVKNIEWRPRPLAGMANTIPRAINNRNEVLSALVMLDNRTPAWTRKVLDNAGSIAGTVVKMAATGLGNYARTQAAGFLRQLV